VDAIRPLFLATSCVARDLIAGSAIAAGWDGPSALERWSVAGLAGHLARATGSVIAYLDRPQPAAEPISPAAYYSAATESSDLDSELHTAIRERGDAEAAEGHAALVSKLSDQIVTLSARLTDEPDDRVVQVFKDLVVTLNDYLRTRIVELTVHIDDLAASVGVPTPELPPGARTAAIETLVAVGAYRHGELAVLRALTRRERDEVHALRVL
jgi:hypothetical protein